MTRPSPFVVIYVREGEKVSITPTFGFTYHDAKNMPSAHRLPADKVIISFISSSWKGTF
jgi:hypothetical protein